MIAATLFNGAVELFLDDAGIDALISELRSLRGKTTHVHMMTHGWGGKELAENVPHGDLVNHLIVYSNTEFSKSES
ncbi:MAG: immunity protein 32 [Alphaproteobacteria bacterium]|nr:immunity protein 32 [Alphaproteobacteria bacterium]MBL7096513.1 immunity protein 32 [Alphaproteobacteria bacterium]